MSKQEVTDHLKKFDTVQRKALQSVRETIAAALPDAEQVIKYGMPTFTVNGKAVIGFDGFKNHNSIFPYSGSLNSRLKEELANYIQTKGSIHFDVAKAMPQSLLRKIVKERLKEMAEKGR
jgi:uncharacterized protein YdhG (YjbR/CyaY superfamily)